MAEIVFVVEDCPEGGYLARGSEHSIFTCAPNIEELKEQVRDAVVCHFDCEEERPCDIRLKMPDGEVVAL